MTPPSLSPGSIRRCDLPSLTLTPMGKEKWSKARILKGVVGSEKILVKDFASKGLFTRWVLGWYAVRREWKAYRLLDGLHGIPKGYQKLDRYALCIQYIEGRPLKRELGKRIDKIFFQKLETLVSQMHSRGVVHLDLHQKRNILVDAGTDPYLVDFSSSFAFGNLFLFKNTLFPLLKKIDRYGILKFKARYAPHLLSPKEERALRSFLFLRRLWIFSPFRKSRKRAGRGRT